MEVSYGDVHRKGRMLNMAIKKRFWETEGAYKRRCDLEAAKASVGAKRLWRIYAIEMLPQKNGGWQMGMQDHFTVEACSEEMAIGVFKHRNGRMSWFVTKIAEETVAV